MSKPLSPIAFKGKAYATPPPTVVVRPCEAAPNSLLTHQVIALARTYIADPRHWTQGVQALFKNGRVAQPHDSRAWRFCATGALTRAAFNLTSDHEQADDLSQLACEALMPECVSGVDSVESINDDRHGHARILALFDDHLEGV